MTPSLLTAAAPWWRPDSGDAMVIRGGAPLVGTYPISGAKNAVLPLMVSALLTPHLVTLRNVPATDRKSTRLNSSHYQPSRMPSSA